MEEMERQKWKAKPVDKRIFMSLGELGVPKVAAKEATVFQEFNFHYEKRHPIQESGVVVHDSEKDSDFHFKATPMPKFNDKRTDQPIRSTKPLTESSSPKLSGPRRASSAPPRRQLPHHEEIKKKEKQNEAERLLKAHMPMTLTEPIEFRLKTEERGSIADSRLKRNLEEEKAKEIMKHEFMARVYTGDKKSFVPQPSTKELTDFVAFDLKSEVLHEMSVLKTQREVEDRRKKDQAEMNFYAREIPGFVKKPEASFHIKKEPKEPTRPLPVHLTTEERVKKRKLFEKELARRRKEQIDCQRQLELQREMKEIENIKILRRKPIDLGGLCFKANPLPGQIREDTKTVSKNLGHIEVPGPSSEQTILMEKSLNSCSSEEPTQSLIDL